MLEWADPARPPQPMILECNSNGFMMGSRIPAGWEYTVDALRLLATLRGSGAMQVCGVDYGAFDCYGHERGPQVRIYDLWALTMADGTTHLTPAAHNLDAWPGAGADCAPAPAECPGLQHDDAPFAVHSCWNGITLFDARVFAAGVRFRWGTSLDPAHAPSNDTECHSISEVLVAHDMWRLGLGRIALDPGVPVAYQSFVHQWKTRRFVQVVPPPTTFPDSQPLSVECHQVYNPGHNGNFFAQGANNITVRMERNVGPLPYGPEWREWPQVQLQQALWRQSSPSLPVPPVESPRHDAPRAQHLQPVAGAHARLPAQPVKASRVRKGSLGGGAARAFELISSLIEDIYH